MIRLRRPSWFAVLLTLAGMALFVRLGVWQLDRAQQKEQWLRRFATASSAPARDFAEVAGTVRGFHWPHVRVAGHFLLHRVYYLDDQTYHGMAGVQVYAPFKVSGHARLLLVDMGWLPRHGGDSPAAISMPPLPAGQVTLHGLYAPAPGVGFRMGGNALSRQSQWPKTTIYMDFRQVAADLGRPVYPRRLLPDAESDSPYVRVWKPTFMPPARHEGYAFQWFAFAAAALVIFVILHRKKSEPPAA